jgi:hypothetical protein
MRFDFVLSYWLFTWWVLYYIGVLPFNPKLFLVAGLIENTIQLIFFTLENQRLFVLINVFIKVIPLILVWNTVTTKRDTAFGVILGLVYLAWLKLNQEEVFRMRTPMMDFLRKYNLS